MRLTFHDDQIAVLDDVLAPEVFGSLWTHLQTLRYESIHGDRLHGVWRLLDGNPFKGPLVVLLADEEAARPEAQALAAKGKLLFPTGTPLDAVLQALEAAPAEARNLVGEWFALNARSWIYPVGTRLSWHDDAAAYAGAFTYYAHPSWNALWGGELLVANAGIRGRAVMPLQASTAPFAGQDALQLDNQAENEELLREGHGRFIAAKPNRLVFVAAGVSHMVAQVHPAAGDHPRVSVSGFFLRRPRTGAETLDYLFGPQP